MSKTIKHLKLICTHKHEVFKAMALCGHPIRGLLHDMSKLTPTEFAESIKYFQGDRSPIEAAKEAQGYSMAWFHHRGRNPHHSQYWCDISFGEVVPCEMPWKYLLELVCDTIGAGKAYMGNAWTDSAPLDYYSKRDYQSFYHPETRKKLISIYSDIDTYGWKAVAYTIKTLGDIW